MNKENPIRMAIDIQEAEKLQAAKESHLPIHVCCILDEYSDFNDPILHNIRDYCIIKNVLFTTRTYDSDKYSCDRYFIERLPALHIYMRKSYERTYYPNTRPLQHIDEVVEKYEKQLEYKKLKKTLWRKRIIAFIKWIRSLTHRKTRIEKYNEEQAADWESRNKKNH